MQDLQMLDTIERYMRGEMLPEERVFFEHLRKTNPAVDQMVVEHTIFLNQMNRFGDRKILKETLSEIESRLFESGAMGDIRKPRVVKLWKRYKKVVAVAAFIAGVTALAISGLVSYVSPKVNEQKVEQLSRQIQNQEKTIGDLRRNLNEKAPLVKPMPDVPVKTGGTGFLIDGRGWIITNAHVVAHANTVVVQNNIGKEFNARIVKIEPETDLAFLKIEDEDFKPLTSLPYGISKANTDLGEQIFTLGYPRDEIVYGEGYMSAKTGFEGDTLACQIAVAANPGNSGGPVINKNGEVVGVLSTRQSQAQGVVFAIRSKNIFKLLEEIKSDSSYSDIKVPLNSSIKGMERSLQIKKIETCVFMVKSY
jgi:S1-C subfamily serine protease